MAWDFFRRRASDDTRAALWWRDADAAALGPTAAALDDLRPRMAAPDQLDSREREEEMLDALERLLAAAAQWPPLPVVGTQHRVIGADRCHFLAPVSAPDHGDAAGKLFLTSDRVIFAGGASIAWPWHRVRRTHRHDRDLVFEAGESLTLRLRCNTYADAVLAAALARRIRPEPPRAVGT